MSEQALPVATALAYATGGHLVLVRAAGRRGLAGLDVEERQLWDIDEANTYLTSIAKRLTDVGLVVETATPFEPADEAILAEVTIRHADLVIMTTHGRSGLKRMFYGSVAEAVLERSPVPVWLVRATEEPAAAMGAEPRWLVPLDGSMFSEEVLPVARKLARTFGATLALYHVFTPPPPLELAVTEPVYVEGLRILNKEEAETYLSEWAERLRLEGLSVETVVREGDPAEAILADSQALGTSLIIMATHGRSGLGRALYGSVALSVLRHGALPMLIMRPTGPHDSQPWDPVNKRIRLYSNFELHPV